MFVVNRGSCWTSFLLWRNRLAAGIQVFALHASTALSFPPDCWPVTGVPSGNRLLIHTSHPPHRSEGMPERSWRIHKSKRFWRCQKKQRVKKHNDVCYRNGALRVPTRAAAQLGAHVFARQPEGRFWCAQNRAGHPAAGREHLQAQRSWSQLQLSEQLLPSEEWGTVPLCHKHAE